MFPEQFAIGARKTSQVPEPQLRGDVGDGRLARSTQAQQLPSAMQTIQAKPSDGRDSVAFLKSRSQRSLGHAVLAGQLRDRKGLAGVSHGKIDRRPHMSAPAIELPAGRMRTAVGRQVLAEALEKRVGFRSGEEIRFARSGRRVGIRRVIHRKRQFLQVDNLVKTAHMMFAGLVKEICIDLHLAKEYDAFGVRRVELHELGASFDRIND